MNPKRLLLQANNIPGVRVSDSDTILAKLAKSVGVKTPTLVPVYGL